MRPKIGKEKIVQTAALLFAENGYHATSVEKIAKKAGVSKGLTYNYFSSKEALLLAILDMASQEMFAVADTSAPSGDYQSTLRSILDQYLLMLQSNKKFLSFQLSLLLQPDLKDIIRAPLQDRVDHLIVSTQAMFHGAGFVEPNLIARRFITELDGIAIHALSPVESFPVDEMIEQVFQNYKDVD